MLKSLVILSIGLFLVGLCVCAPIAPSSPTDFFSESDRRAITSLISSSKSKDGSFGSLADTFYAVNISRSPQYSDAAKLIDTSLTCQYAKQYLNNKQTVESLYYAISIVETLNCGSAVGNDVTTVLLSGVRPSSKLETKYLAVAAIARLSAAGHITFDESELSGLVSNLVALQEHDGTFRSEVDVKGSSALNSGYVAHILTLINAQDQETSPDEVLESLFDIFKDANEEDEDVFYFTGDSRLDDLKATALVLSGVNSLLQSGIADRATFGGSVTRENIVGIAEFAVRHKRVATLRDAFYLNILLEAVSNNEWHVPLVLTLSQGSLFASSRRAGGTGNEGSAKIRVTDIYGRFAAPATVYIVRAYAVDDPRNVVLTNQEAVASTEDNTAYSFNFLAKKPEPGYYTIEFSITPKGQSRFSAIKDNRNIKVVSSVDVVDAQIRVSNTRDSEDNYGAVHTASYPNSVAQPISASSAQYLSVSFRVKNQVSSKPVKVHQAFVRLTHVESGHTAASFNAKSVKSGQYSLTVDLNSQSGFHGVSGKYALEIVVGDPFIANAVSWNIATLDISFPAQSGSQGQARPTRGRVPTTIESKISGSNRGGRPDIEHQFRKADRRPPAVVSLAGGVLAVGNLDNYPRGASTMMALGFHVCLGLILGLFVIYWLALNIVQMLGYLFVLSFPTIFFGLKTLQSVYLNRTKSN
eukprot:TRINITY_DN1342_c0_g1_i1.p1 TRINITY_DN1342_c0_g1~~TRINITY_DN1342_c0_g1_i1.p1  ORF type:complete len:697 (-),score=172.62 TRINITY_DN1342_c0_g1_i1:118-2208(-)